MEDFGTINEIINNSIRSSSYISVLISSGVFIIYTFINKLIEYYKAKDNNKPIMLMSDAIKEVSQNVIKLNAILDKTLQNIEQKENIKCKNIITLAFNSFQNKISSECINMIIHNHIEENKDYVTENIVKIVTTEFYNMYSVLAVYEVDTINIANKLDKRCIEEITNSIITIMYNKQSELNRIVQLNHRLSVDINNYITHTYNKVFND